MFDDRGMSRSIPMKVDFISPPGRMTGRLVLILALWLAYQFPNDALAALPKYVVRNLLVEDGLPEDSVSSVLQTSDGYIWAGTYSGLARFDGVRFTVFDSDNTPELAGSRISCLFEDKQGVLWVGHEGGELTSYDGKGHFHPEPVRPSWRGRKIFGIAAEDSGEVWMVNDQGVLGRVEDGMVISPQPGQRQKLVGFAPGFDGSIWVTRDGYPSVLRHNALTPEPLDGPPATSYVQGICASRDGSLWVASKNLVRKWNGTAWVGEGMPAPWGTDSPLTAFVETPGGMLAAGTQDQGLFLIGPEHDTQNFNRTNGLLNDWVRSLCVDKEGNLWVGTGGGGLAMLRPSCVEAARPPDQWEGRSVLSVCSGGDGGVWVGTEGAGLYHFKEGKWSRFDQTAGLMNLFVWSVAEDADGRLWAGTWGAGLFNGTNGAFNRAPGLENITVPMTALLTVPGDGIWIGTEAGLLHYDGKHGAWFGQNREAVRTDVRTIVKAGDGTVWFGMLGGGLARMSNGVVQHFGTADGLSSDFVQCLHLDSEGALWIGTFGGGLNRFKNHVFTAITTRQGLPNNIIGCIMDDSNGSYWMSSHAGIIRASKAELDGCADGKTNFVRCVSFGRSDGLPTLECSTGFQPSGCKTPDGRLWFPTGKGLVAIDPKGIRINHRPPPVVIETVQVDGHVCPNRSDSSSLQIAPGEHRIEIDYTALSFVAPEKVRFRYQLSGLETHWEEAGTRRNAEFAYPPPGRYIFRVLACNNDGLWNTEGAVFAFQILPHFWQTTWFILLAAAVIMAGAGVGVHLDARRRLHRKLELLERQRAVERERSRIARDIHDDLGASLTLISFLTDAVPADAVKPPQAAEALRRIFTISRHLVQALDEIVWAVNPRFDTLESLAAYLGNFAQETLEIAAIRYRLDTPVCLPARPLTTEVRHVVFLAFKEALNNVLKHAAATEVTVSLALKNEALVLSVEDNGKGFTPLNLEASSASPTVRQSGGFGLTSMRLRMAEIGGQCEIQSAPECGSIVRFIIPLNLKFSAKRQS
jgi:signal transduction histidine kinase/ligand-binding sensor domain-containing protein